MEPIPYSTKSKKKFRRVSYPRGCKGMPKRMFIFKKSYHMRRWLVQNPWIKPMNTFNYCAIKIQALMRGCLIRQWIYGDRVNVIMSSTGKLIYDFIILPRNERYKKGIKSPRASSQRQLDRYMSCMDFYRRNDLNRPNWLEQGFSGWCAMRIQAWWRMIFTRRMFLIKSRGGVVVNIAAITIQCLYRAILYRRYKAKIEYSNRFNMNAKVVMAIRIQLCWRSFCNRRIFKYFSDLIVHKLKGAPSEILRSIIPNECHLLDKAAGIHVRFRLGGNVFPPKVYFKLFTHRPLCDVNAFAPRDYTQEKLIDSFQVHNKSTVKLPPKAAKKAIRVGASYFDTRVVTTGNIANWYQREDGNQWRPISSQLFEDILTPPWVAVDPVTNQPINKKKKLKFFHFNNRKRRELAEIEKKKKKSEWIIKLARLTQQEKEKEIFEGSSTKYDVNELNEDELLDWSMALDYEDYSSYWGKLAVC